MSTEHEIMTVKQAADLTQLSRKKIYELVAQGNIPRLKTGRAIRIFRPDLIEALRDIQKAKTGYAASYRNRASSRKSNSSQVYDQIIKEVSEA